ncbi:MAG: sodium ion-translocating decarboxylase subunit beta, partial [Clostridia bacterium]|nr:sodium ion-translocating decarboxylase subunit beta [Clostridia bacterium]
MLQTFLDSIMSLWEASGFAALTWRECLMLCISFVLMYLAIKKGFEPLLLLPIAFGMFLANLPLTHLAVVDGGMGEGLLNVL